MKMSLAKKWKTQTMQHRINAWIAHNKKVNQYTKDWKFIKVWQSWAEIVEILNLNRWGVSRCCTWKANSCWWFIFKFTN